VGRFVQIAVASCALAACVVRAAEPVAAPPPPKPLSPPPAAQATDKFLATKGLVKVNNWVVLTDEAEIRTATRALRAARTKVAAEATARADVERAIRRTIATFDETDAPFVKANQRLAANPKDNQAVAAVNVLIGQRRQLATRLESLDKQFKAIGDGRPAFITDVLALAKRVDAAVAAYAEVPKDAEVTAAIAAMNRGAAAATPPVRAGPSDAFNLDAAFVRECQAQISSNVLPVEIRGGVPHLDVLVNGKATFNMVWDSGAASVVLSHAMAKEAGLSPSSHDPEVKVTVADGRTLTARRMRLASVRVGSLTAENVECTVMPADAKDVSGLLGGTFQRNFICNLDLQRRELSLTRLDDPKPTTRPSGTAVATTQRTGPLPVARRGKTVDLLAIVDPTLDTVKNTWVRQKGLLVSDGGEYTRIQFPYHPPEEYDLRIVFRRTEGNSDISTVMAKNGASFLWIMSAFDNRVAGFHSIRGVNVRDNATAVKRPKWFVNGTTHSSVVKVRNKSVQAFVDEQLVSTWKTEDYSEMSHAYPLDDTAALGLQTHKSRVEFVRVEVTEVTGQGEFTREVQDEPKK
jgi:aspartyl protease family protein